MMKGKIYLFLIVLVFLALIGCVSNTPLNSAFLDEKGKTIGVAFVQLPPVGAHKEGGTGLLDMALNEALAVPLQKHLNEFDISEFKNINEGMKTKLESMGMTVNLISDYISVEGLPKDEDTKNVDYSSIKEQYDVDYLMLLSVEKIGTVREYAMGIIPKGKPDAICVGKGRLINLYTNELYWEYEMSEREAVIEIERPWNTPPDYSNLDVALNMAISNSINVIVNNLEVEIN